MYASIAEMVSAAQQQQTPLSEVILQAEMAQSQAPRAQLMARMAARLDVMRASVNKGLNTPVRSLSGMSNGNAYRFNQWLKSGGRALTGPALASAVARAIATSEVNAGMGCIVATPTAGSAGVLPAVLLTLEEQFHLSTEQLLRAMFTAGGIGAVIQQRATLSGAAGGCQAETGSAAAMAAGAAVELLGGAPDQSAQAVAITLKNMLGLVCDPVAGLVEIPCIKRNAAAVAQCFVAVDLALAGIESVIPADEVIDAMYRVGQRMDERFRETAQGGLAITPTARALTAALLQQFSGKPQEDQ